MTIIKIIKENNTVFEYTFQCKRYCFINHLRYEQILHKYKKIADDEYSVFIIKKDSTKQFSVIKKNNTIVFYRSLIPHLIYDLNDIYSPIPLIIQRGMEKILSIYVNNSNSQAITSAIYYLKYGLHNITYKKDMFAMVFYDSVCVDNIMIDKTKLLNNFCKSLDQEVHGYYQYGFDNIFEIVVYDLLENN